MNGPHAVKCLAKHPHEAASGKAKTRRPDFARLVDWVEGRLHEDEVRAVEETLAGADSATLADIAWLRGFLEAAANVVIESPPPGVRETLIQLFEAKRRS
jgi:hypothetical protein